MAFIAHNPASRRHDMPDHPETAQRADAILRAFDADPRFARLVRIVPDRVITREEALRTHSLRLWHNLESVGPHVPAYLDPDTYVVEGSVEAARSTARLGMQAVERALSTGEGGFVVARPPGHHATHDRSMGFCLLNNVAIAAHHGLERGAKRILVFDHDVHHGNGTQDIFYASDQVLYQSFHLGRHYPGSGKVDETGSGPGAGFTVNAPLHIGDGEPQVRSLLRHVFLPTAKAFAPDLVLVSSGFDSMRGDPLGGLDLGPAFYGEMVASLRRICPRVVCFLEGGYQLSEIPKAAVAELAALISSATPTDEAIVAPECEAALREQLAPHWPGIE